MVIASQLIFKDGVAGMQGGDTRVHPTHVAAVFVIYHRASCIFLPNWSLRRSQSVGSEPD